MPHRFPPARWLNALTLRGRQIVSAQRAGHKPVWRQLGEIATVKWGPNHLSALEYHALRLYDAEFHPGEQLADYGGYWLKEHLHERLNLTRWEGMATDKAIMYALFKALDLPHPQVYALSTRQVRQHDSDCSLLHTRQALAHYLRHAAPYPLFCKPIKGSHARGSWRLERYHPDDDCVESHDGHRHPVSQFTAKLHDPAGYGVLLQRAMLTAPALRPLCGEALTGCRIILLRHDDGAKAFRAVWKIPTANSHVDNFCGGHSGNLIAALDPASGRVERVLGGAGLAMKQYRHHPVTGAELLGRQLPGWAETLELVTRAAECFPGFRWQHWDVGFTDQGPVFYEMNSAGDIDGIELCTGRGILDPELRAFLQRYGDPQAAAEQGSSLLFAPSKNRDRTAPK